jgi:hypothetical protein
MRINSASSNSSPRGWVARPESSKGVIDASATPTVRSFTYEHPLKEVTGELKVYR